MALRMLHLSLTLTNLIFLAASPVVSIETVSISYPSAEHACVTNCILNTGCNFCYSDINNVLNCGSPYANDCFCATATASASLATSWIAACASSSCSVGDISDDITAMHSLYASYCIGASYTQPGATDWYNPATATLPPAPGQTSSLGPGMTSTATEVTLVTQTVSSSSLAGSVTMQPQGKLLILLAMAQLAMLLQVPLPFFHFLQLLRCGYC